MTKAQEECWVWRAMAVATLPFWVLLCPIIALVAWWYVLRDGLQEIRDRHARNDYLIEQAHETAIRRDEKK